MNFNLSNYVLLSNKTNKYKIKDFDLQIEKILDQFYRSTIDYFHHLIDTVNLYIQVDQPFMIRYSSIGSMVNLDSKELIEKNPTNIQRFLEVSRFVWNV